MLKNPTTPPSTISNVPPLPSKEFSKSSELKVFVRPTLKTQWNIPRKKTPKVPILTKNLLLLNMCIKIRKLPQQLCIKNRRQRPLKKRIFTKVSVMIVWIRCSRILILLRIMFWRLNNQNRIHSWYRVVEKVGKNRSFLKHQSRNNRIIKMMRIVIWRSSKIRAFIFTMQSIFWNKIRQFVIILIKIWTRLSRFGE